MLFARGSVSLRASAFRVAFVFGRGIWCKLVDQDFLAYDTRYLPGAPGMPKPRVCIYLLVTGNLETYGRTPERYTGPSAIALTLDQLEGALERRELPLRAWGESCSVIEVHLDASLFMRRTALPQRLELPEEVWARARSAIQSFHVDEDRAMAELVAMLEALAANGLLDRGAVARAIEPMPALLEQLWQGLRPMVEKRLLSAGASDIAEGAGVTRRRAEQAMQYFIGSSGLLGTGIRFVMNRLRLKAAVIFLSSKDATVAEVATLSGYGSADAMARAFRDAGLPPPRLVREGLAKSESLRPAMNGTLN